MSDTNEEIVGRVLQGLRDTTPPAGMDSRVLIAVRHRAPAMPVPARYPWRIAFQAGSAVLAGVVCVLFFTTHRRAPQVSFPHPQPMSMQAADGPLTPSMAATRKPPKPAFRRVKLARALPPREGLAAISYPAPPMPLTDQERLLLKLAHKGDLVQLAMLDPIRRTARYAEERDEIQKFFAPSTPGEDK